MLNQYSQEMPVTEIPMDQLTHIATCDGWHSKDRADALNEIKKRQFFEAYDCYQQGTDETVDGEEVSRLYSQVRLTNQDWQEYFATRSDVAMEF